MDPIDRFVRHVDFNGECWEWTGGLSKGYGRFAAKSTRPYVLAQAHRWFYEYVYGELDKRLHLDHTCRNRKCVNLDHLEPVTQRENMRRGVSPTARWQNTHCVNDHAFTPENTRIRPNGTRACRECHRLEEKKRRAKG